MGWPSAAWRMGMKCPTAPVRHDRRAIMLRGAAAARSWAEIIAAELTFAI
jgi:hypothetical protein